MDKMKRMKELLKLLTEASKAYYQEDREIMSNFEYDKLYDELVQLDSFRALSIFSASTPKKCPIVTAARALGKL